MTTRSAISTPVSATERLLSESTSFQTRVGVASAADALEKIELFELEADPEEFQSLRPFAVIFPGAVDWSRASAGEGNNFTAAGIVTVRLTDICRVPGTDHGSRRAAAVDFADWMGDVIEDILDSQGVDDRLQIQRIRLAEGGGVWRSPTKDEGAAGSYWWGEFQVFWGNAG